ncbi:NAD(P)-dependent dehydrogenase (short-subunit alcohol dehydrogenase family) [Saccharothrix coeruleofusca]|uniref:SDR family oxidoreductase n=1 Tax=Saccharothrix coeruleofusca TaxID=33919 RepID=UPI001AE118DC|nr:SDR family oxidoreductase [Saccharothrix coeruleofusca]MBP2340735.1 NAD(P)-dependent dehydrogenase (short-subunit alcohol dehydrogenase family) [Saccharothrix coeruleofusca]
MLTGRTALVTGASRGIGRAIARRLARDGATVVVHYARDDAAAKEVVESIRADGGAAGAVRAELPDELDDLVRALPDELDIVVNNAGVVARGTIEQIHPDEFDRVFTTNVRAPFLLVQRLLPRLRDGGRIINISSGVTRAVNPELIAYAMTKGALDTFSKTLAQHLGPRGITVNTVAPGAVDTDMNADWLRDNPDSQAAVSAQNALGRVGTPTDVAGVVAFLASEDSRWITANWLDATGGGRL